MKIKFYPQKCVGCLLCMTNQDCRILIDAIRRGGPRFGEEKCDSIECTKCIDRCPGNALTLRYGKAKIL